MSAAPVSYWDAAFVARDRSAVELPRKKPRIVQHSDARPRQPLALGSRIAPALNSGPALQMVLDLALASSLGAPVQPGQTRSFQAWHRDVGVTNLTDAVEIDFAPSSRARKIPASFR